jgi:hypothetical protein
VLVSIVFEGIGDERWAWFWRFHFLAMKGQPSHEISAAKFNGHFPTSVRV